LKKYIKNLHGVEVYDGSLFYNLNKRTRLHFSSGVLVLSITLIHVLGRVIRFPSFVLQFFFFNFSTPQLYWVGRQTRFEQSCLHCPQFNYWRYFILLYSSLSHNHLHNKQFYFESYYAWSCISCTYLLYYI